jgi:hypothetical protein
MKRRFLFDSEDAAAFFLMGVNFVNDSAFTASSDDISEAPEGGYQLVIEDRDYPGDDDETTDYRTPREG